MILIAAANILLSKNGDVKLDLGISEEATKAAAKRQQIVGTPYWMAPEVLKQTACDTEVNVTKLSLYVAAKRQTIVVTPYWMAPEVLKQTACDTEVK